jgi:hypothetical protein
MRFARPACFSLATLFAALLAAPAFADGSNGATQDPPQPPPHHHKHRHHKHHGDKEKDKNKEKGGKHDPNAPGGSAQK